ncbi:hypothetical protein JSO19_00175 [Leucobacter sp. UCMA 4100]|uniref:hypothetical protein n=1 Tax=Leucobacter sp. UCMA 4100 TaxID=2810534 RepID=UPI0022EADCD1|nr:hypothetical protein [Leucobacter sp. UCMA 4100]MDA3145794.1 hypothetical protein [Leucobacter sp. UCMA 4100]
MQHVPQRRRPGTQVQRLSWSLPVPDGAYSRIPAWSNREQWLTRLMEALRTPEGESARRRISITLTTLLRIATLDAESADSRNGRGVATSHDTVANTIGCCKRTVQRGRELIQQLGFAVVVVPGRYLTKAERAEAAALHGSAQRRAASVRALTLPAPTPAASNVHLPRRGFINPLAHLRINSPKRAGARKAAPRPGAIEKKKSAPKKRTMYRPEVAHIAQELTTRLPFLGRWRSLVTERPGCKPELRHQGEHIGTICRVIVKSGLDTQRMTGADVIEVLDRLTADTGLQTMTGEHVKNPLGYLTTLLRRALAYIEREGYATVAERREAAQERRAQIQAQQAADRAEREAERARANTPEAIAAREAFFENWRAEKATRINA